MGTSYMSQPLLFLGLHQEVDKFLLTLNIPEVVSYVFSPDLKATVAVNMAILSGWAEGTKVLVTREVTHNTT